ncbi:antibiotic biosynthesis monooxygenase family protein [Amycolatopsis sp. lyj-108]|uniref:antibiotic biosynthesis monooxygenase family protein n=1 Tax=Amycolatopsis sp. lyj-108 TaxID=2789286 RepID=UPI003978843A
MADSLVSAWKQSPWPPDVLSWSCFISTDGANVLSYTQSTADHPHTALPCLGGTGEQPTVYQLYRSLTTAGETRVPGCVVTALFATDGPRRQREFVDTLLAALPEDEGHPGAISAHFHLSVDGTRLLNYTEWTAEEAHREAATSGAHDDLHDIFANTPGVRSLRGKRYHLHHSLTAPATT